LRNGNAAGVATRRALCAAAADFFVNYNLMTARQAVEKIRAATADFMPGMVISGGQTGADRAGLDAAVAAGIPVGGFMPKGALAEDGRVPSKYNLTELASAGYAARTLHNIECSDATIILHLGEISGGTLLTATQCARLKKPLLCVDIRKNPSALRQLRRFLSNRRPAVLNIAGPRESKSPGIHEKSLALLTRLFSKTP